MWKFLSGVVNSFLLLRDVFGYTTSGALFVALMLYRFRAHWLDLYLREHDKASPFWFLLMALLCLCYVAGHILAAIGYSILTPLKKRFCKSCRQAETADLLYYRYVYPSLFIEADRRDTLNILRIGLAVGLVAASVLFPWRPLAGLMLAGLFMLYNGYTGMKSVAEHQIATVEAGQRAETNQVSYFRWDGCCEKKTSDDEQESEDSQKENSSRKA